MLRRGCLLGLVFLLSCEPHALTQIVIAVQAGPQVGSLTTRTTLVVTRNPNTDATVVHDDRNTPRTGGFPYVIALSPTSDAADEIAFAVSVTALTRTKPLLTARLLSGYVAGQTRYVRLVLEDACLDVACPADLTCHAGSCIGATVAPTGFASDEANAPTSADLRTRADAALPGSVREAGGDSGLRDAGASDAAPGSQPGPAEDKDAGDARDSARPSGVSPGRDELDASHDASEPARADAAPPSRAPDASVSDASRPAPPDASSPTNVPDAGPTVTCMPSGTYSVTRIQQTGTCNADIGAFDVTFSGKISDPFASDQCKLDAMISPDGCSMTYDQLCTTGDGEEVEREVASVRFTSPNTISGPGKVTRYDTSKGSGPSSPTCTSEVIITAVRK